MALGPVSVIAAPAPMPLIGAGLLILLGMYLAEGLIRQINALLGRDPDAPGGLGVAGWAAAATALLLAVALVLTLSGRR